MKFIKFLLLIFILITASIKANSNEIIVEEIKNGGKLIFIRHAYAPGSGDPVNFKIKDCSTQRNLNEIGKNQAKIIGLSFVKNDIPIDEVISSEWCRCKETAFIAFKNYATKNFLNSFYEPKFYKNKKKQIKDLKKYINNWHSEKNLVLITHYVVISEILGVYPSSGEIVIADKHYKVIGNLESNF